MTQLEMQETIQQQKEQLSRLRNLVEKMDSSRYQWLELTKKAWMWFENHGGPIVFVIWMAAQTYVMADLAKALKNLNTPREAIVNRVSKTGR